MHQPSYQTQTNSSHSNEMQLRISKLNGFYEIFLFNTNVILLGLYSNCSTNSSFGKSDLIDATWALNLNSYHPAAVWISEKIKALTNFAQGWRKAKRKKSNFVIFSMTSLLISFRQGDVTLYIIWSGIGEVTNWNHCNAVNTVLD